MLRSEDRDLTVIDGGDASHGEYWYKRTPAATTMPPPDDADQYFSAFSKRTIVVSWRSSPSRRWMSSTSAITSTSHGDVELEVVQELVDDVFPIDGIAAILSDPPYPVFDLLEQARRVNDRLARNPVLDGTRRSRSAGRRGGRVPND